MFLELVQKRYSLRKFKDKEIEKDKLEDVIEAGRLSPTAVNLQPLHYMVVSEEKLRQEIMDTYSREWIKGAPTIIVVCLDHSKSWKRRDGKDHGDIDGGIAIANMTLAATELGLGTCIVCNYDSKRLHEVLDLPEDYEVIALLPIGYPSDNNIPKKKRNSLEDITTWKE